MKVTVFGAGVIGVATAYYLARAGHDVTVVDRQAGVGLETSFANAGEISPGYASPWAAPDVPRKALKWLFMEHAPLIVQPRLDPAMLAWLWATLRNCSSARYAVNKARMVRLAEYSRDQLIALRRRERIAYDERAQGTLQLFRTQAQLDGVGKDIEVLKAGGVPFQLLSKADCIGFEPGLAASRETIAGGLRLPNDETGDCLKFTQGLAAVAQGLGVSFRLGETLKRLHASGGRISAAETDAGALQSDAYVLALGSYSPQLVRSLGLRLPVYPVKGYSITAPITHAPMAPVSTLLDESYKVAITRLGDRIRVGGMAELSGFSAALPERRRRTLEYSVGGLFPEAADLTRASYWSGLRPMTPDGTPIIGPTAIDNLYLNTGHGTLGWTMACGSGRILSDLMSGLTPQIDTHDLALGRYGSRRP